MAWEEYDCKAYPLQASDNVPEHFWKEVLKSY